MGYPIQRGGSGEVVRLRTTAPYLYNVQESVYNTTEWDTVEVEEGENVADLVNNGITINKVGHYLVSFGLLRNSPSSQNEAVTRNQLQVDGSAIYTTGLIRCNMPANTDQIFMSHWSHNVSTPGVLLTMHHNVKISSLNLTIQPSDHTFFEVVRLGDI